MEDSGYQLSHVPDTNGITSPQSSPMQTIKSLFYFDTFQIVSVHTVKLGILHRVFQVAVLGYIFIYSIYIAKGYQEKTDVAGVLFTKVKGVGFINQTIDSTLFDSTDLIIPPVETDAMFILTGYVTTIQTRSTCPSNLPQDSCHTNADCIAGTISQIGIVQPQCNNSIPGAPGFCNLYAWCPLENDTVTTTIANVQNLTLFLRSSVTYEKFNIQISDPDVAIMGQNVFYLSQIVGESIIDDCVLRGCIVQILIDWSCDLDKQNCNSIRSYQKMADGFNYRRADYYYTNPSDPNNSGQFRVIQKLYGIRLLFKIIGMGGKFTFLQLIITIGSGLAFMSVATLIVDTLMILLFFKDDTFQKKKYLQFVEGEEGGIEVA